ncbi:MAG: hypothetical protein ABI165_15885 [Bryobacteraceae bacterium]
MRVNNAGTDINSQIAAQGPAKDAAIKDAAKVNHALAKSSDPSIPSEKSDQIQLSHLSQAVTTPSETRLEQLRAAVANGSFSVSAAKISSSIVTEHILNSAHTNPGSGDKS